MILEAYVLVIVQIAISYQFFYTAQKRTLIDGDDPWLKYFVYLVLVKIDYPVTEVHIFNRHLVCSISHYPIGLFSVPLVTSMGRILAYLATTSVLDYNILVNFLQPFL